MFRHCLILLFLCVACAHAHEGLHVEIDTLTQHLQKHPEDAEARLKRARRLRLHGKPEQALRDLALLPPHLAQAMRTERGLIHLHAEAFAAAELDLRAADGSATSWAATARACWSQGCDTAALQALRTALDARPDLEDYLLGGEILRATHQPEQAIAWYREGLQRLGPALLLRRALVAACLEADRPLAALAALDEDLQRSPGVIAWKVLAADALAQAGLHDRARALRYTALQETERQLQRRATILKQLQRVEILLALNERAPARRQLDQVLARAPDLPMALQLDEQLRTSTPAKEHE